VAGRRGTHGGEARAAGARVRGDAQHRLILWRAKAQARLTPAASHHRRVVLWLRRNEQACHGAGPAAWGCELGKALRCAATASSWL